MTTTVPAVMTVEGLTAAGQAAAILAGNVKLVGDCVQVVNSQVSTVATGATIMPFDDTIPQNTEGDQYLTLAITPVAAANILEIDVTLHGTNAAGVGHMSAALFRDAGANALAAVAQVVGAAGQVNQLHMKFRVVAGSVSATTFNVRMGFSVAGTTTFNGAAGARLFGGVMMSSITIREIKG